MKNDNPNIEEVITMVMAYKGHNQSELSDMLGIAQSSLNGYIKGKKAKTGPSRSNYRQLKKYVSDGLRSICIFVSGSCNLKQSKRIDTIVDKVFAPYLNEE